MELITHLVWNEANIAHIARHHVRTDEVEDVIYGGNYVIRETYSQRLAIIGLTAQGRMLHIVVYPQAVATYFVVTARDADRKEHGIYRQEIAKGGEQAA